jgi:hypothetical protein
MEVQNPALVFRNEFARRRHAALIDFGTHFGIGRELGANFLRELR